MLIYQDARDRPRTTSVLAIGSFDGLHMGHKVLLRKLNEMARQHEAPSVVYTFDQPTRVLLHGAPYLYTLAEKLKLLDLLGVDEVVTVPFTLAFAQRSSEDFIAELRLLNPTAIVVGEDFRFGHDRAGSVATLRLLTGDLLAMPMYSLDGHPVHATRIREALQNGQVEEARRLLGRPYSARGVVVRGQALGRKIGFPTANVAISEGKLLPPGVFASRVLLPDGRLRPGMANVGWRPTVEGDDRRLEVNLLDFSGDLYGEEVRVDFIARLRGEERFAGLEALTEQLRRDEAAARAVLASTTVEPDELGLRG